MIKLEKSNKLFQERARQMRKDSTLSEVLLWNQLKNKQFLGLDFDRQKVINNKYIADLFCPEYNLVIEIDGCSHDDKCEYDAARDEYLKSLGLVVMRIDDLDVKTRMDGVLADIMSFISTTPSAGQRWMQDEI